MADPCDCQSYNRPGETGSVPEVILDPRPFFTHTTKTVCVDACIASQIRSLWHAGIWTRGCCCGHNARPAEVAIDDPAHAERAHDMLRQSGRPWRVWFWAGGEYGD